MLRARAGDKGKGTTSASADMVCYRCGCKGHMKNTCWQVTKLSGQGKNIGQGKGSRDEMPRAKPQSTLNE